MPGLENIESNGQSKVEENDRTRLQVKVGTPPKPILNEQVEDEAENASDRQEREEISAQESIESQPVELGDYQLT